MRIAHLGGKHDQHATSINPKGKETESLSRMMTTLLKSSDPSSTNPRVYLVSEWRTSRQWILSPLAMGRSKLTRASVLGLWMPRGESREAMKSDIWWKLMNCVAWGSYLRGRRK